jgi:threonine-phosphate decarboxylase
MEAAIGAKELMEPWNLNSAAVIAACSIFEDHDYIEKSRAWIKSEREYLYRELGNFNELRVYPSKVNFHLVELISRRMTASQLKADMVKNGILIRTAEGFNRLTEFHLRLAVKDRSSNDVLSRVLKRILQ